MNKILSLILGGAVAGTALTSCDSVSEEDRFTPAEIVAARAVLLQEYTGQACTNCPDGHAAIRDITGALGDSVVAVGIHASGLATNPPLGLKTAVGEEYYKNDGSPALPTAIIDMQTSPLQVTDWGSTINRLIMIPTPFTVIAHASLSADGSKYDIDVDFSSGEDYEGKLMVWICENNIVRRQLDHGTYIDDYVHQHVFRACATSSIWGEDVTLKAHEPQHLSFSYPINPKDYWDTSNLYAVAFLYNDAGVQQVTQSAH